MTSMKSSLVVPGSIASAETITGNIGQQTVTNSSNIARKAPISNLHRIALDHCRTALEKLFDGHPFFLSQDETAYPPVI
jgi:hypothetical protein